MVTSECTARNECLAGEVPFNVTNGVGVNFSFFVFLTSRLGYSGFLFLGGLVRLGV